MLSKFLAQCTFTQGRKLHELLLATGLSLSPSRPYTFLEEVGGGNIARLSVSSSQPQSDPDLPFHRKSLGQQIVVLLALRKETSAGKKGADREEKKPAMYSSSLSQRAGKRTWSSSSKVRVCTVVQGKKACMKPGPTTIILPSQ